MYKFEYPHIDQLHCYIQAKVDLGEGYSKGPFKGLESIFDAVDYLYTGQSKGKVVVELNPSSDTQSKL